MYYYTYRLVLHGSGKFEKSYGISLGFTPTQDSWDFFCEEVFNDDDDDDCWVPSSVGGESYGSLFGADYQYQSGEWRESETSMDVQFHHDRFENGCHMKSRDRRFLFFCFCFYFIFLILIIYQTYIFFIQFSLPFFFFFSFFFLTPPPLPSPPPPQHTDTPPPLTVVTLEAGLLALEPLLMSVLVVILGPFSILRLIVEGILMMVIVIVCMLRLIK